ncbi:hypothetical protein [Sphingomonas sp.]|uniref:hypothetical protein n=1 Tax=Sphingomonas TaxID=13687 RepID=UPI0009599FD5|nr:hypothetical protein [Sphingomonas sp.]MBN8813224.1 hypothetical protein [Sphingomonas sp.]OJY53452.1 MAG: hypothetical protein BGP17_10050 [Sphingomonas sp. 67-41]
MASSPDPGAALVAANAAASTSLRETAKWLVSGVTATAVAVFAGSSLTRLGSLDFTSQPVRFSIAIAGALLGFAGLGLILARAISVLTVESFSFRHLVSSDEPRLVAIRTRIEKGQTGGMPGNAATFKELLERTDAARRAPDKASRTLMANFDIFRPKVMAQAGFFNVKAKFDQLVWALRCGSPMAIVGFGLFAWAANPPEPKPATAGPGPLVVIGPQEVAATQTARACPPARLRHCPTPTPEPSPLIDK